MDRHVLALVSIAGSSIEALGVLYLAYELLGGEHGPLRALTRAVTYGAIFGIGYSVTLGLVFGAVVGLAHAITLGIEYSRASKGLGKPSAWHDVMHSAIRGTGFAVASGYGRRLGMVGITMALTGFFLNSIPYWMIVLDVPVR